MTYTAHGIRAGERCKPSSVVCAAEGMPTLVSALPVVGSGGALGRSILPIPGYQASRVRPLGVGTGVRFSRKSPQTTRIGDSP